MKLKYLILVGVAILVLGGFVLLRDDSSNLTSTKKTSTEASEQPVSENTVPREVPSSAEGRYIDYDEEELSRSSGTRILFFHAPWCPQCRQLESDIKSGNIPSGVTIFKVDYDSSQDLRRKYGVTIQTSLVRLDKNGNLDKKFVAYDEPTLKNLVDNLL